MSKKKDSDSNLTAGNYKNENVEISTVLSMSQSETSKRTDEEAKEKEVSYAEVMEKLIAEDKKSSIIK